MITERAFKPFLFGDREMLVSHPVGTQEDYGLLLTEKKSIDGYESSLSHIIKENVREGDFFLDIGSQIGLFSIFAASLGANVVSFEMRPAIVHCHFETKIKNDITNWLPLAYAVGEGLSQIPFSDEAQFVLMGGAAKSAPVENMVTCIAIDSLGLHVLGRKRTTFVKIDIEGFEVFALRGMQSFIQELRPTMAIECHPHAAWSYGASINEIKSLLPNDYLIQICETHRHESEIGTLKELTGDLPHLDNYIIIASPIERKVMF